MKFSAIYIEEQVADLPRVQAILARTAPVPVITCERYGEVFNRKAQNFRLQKQAPALILASKFSNFVLPAPPGYGFNSQPSFYFSHMLNCVYDCRYCFLQGMYSSANYVLFVNYENFGAALAKKLATCGEPTVFYSGYDCDSLALEPISRFCEYYLPMFENQPDATLEIRTKSTQIRNLLDREPLENVVIAMSFTPHKSAAKWEHKVPAIEKRIEALRKLQQAGWQVALRFEPLLAEQELTVEYQQLFAQIFGVLDRDNIHSVSTGMFRMPADYFKKIVRLYPDEALFAKSTEVKAGLIALHNSAEAEQMQIIENELLRYITSDRYYHCAS